MMPHNPIAIIILIIVVLVFFGANKLPEMAKSLGKSKNAFEEGLREGRVPDDDELKKEKEREAEIRRRVEAEMRQQGK